ncbi:MAG: hypothetical protein GXY34_12360 [Syntrophomonadaceae bacterium]|nr:hypothetical protein [Syntrophomonadaceae bacterium]
MSTLIRSKWVSGLLEFFGVTAGTTVLKITESGIEANVTGNLTGNVTGNVAGILTGGVIGMATIEKAVDYALVAAEKAKLVISAKMTAGGKTLTLGLAAGQIAFVYNHGTETYTVKNVAGDTGTSLATTKLLLVVGSATNDASTVIALN